MLEGENMKVIIERNGKTNVIEGDAVLVAVATDGGIEGCATVGEMVLGRVHEVSVTAGGCSLMGSGGSILAEVPSGVLIHRPAHKAVGADGVEVKAGDTVWLAPEHRGMAQCGTRESGDTCGLSGVDALDRLAVVYTRDRSGVPIASLDRCQAWCPASWLTHTAPCTDKDGAPIDEGDEVWTEDGCGEFEAWLYCPWCGRRLDDEGGDAE